MANIKITELQPAEFAELSDLELEATVGGKGGVLGKVIDIARDVIKVIVPPPQPRPQPRPRPYAGGRRFGW